MFYFNIENQIILITTLCFSFMILLLSLTENKKNKHITLIGSCFFTPLVLGVTSFIAVFPLEAKIYLTTSQSMLIIMLTFSAIFYKYKESYNVIYFINFLFPIFFIIYLSASNYRNFDKILKPLSFAYFIITLIILIISAISKWKDSLLFSGGLFTLSLACASYYSNLPFNTKLWLVFFVSGFILILVYVFTKTVTDLKKENKKLISTLDKYETSIHKEIERRINSIERSNKKLVEITKTDNLSKAFTKKAIIDMIDLNIAKNKDDSLSVLMFDIDKFKSINDTYGHITGDRCIRALADYSKECLRTNDRLGRYGGDEFIIFLPKSNYNNASIVAERIRSTVEKKSKPKFTVSIGVACYPSDGITVKELIDAADKALYKSKESGRNRVSYYQKD